MESAPNLIDALDLRKLVVEQAKRRVEALKLYRPLPLQDAFHASEARTRLARGSNRAGKTLTAAVEVARAVTGQDPHGKFPTQDGRWFCVGKNLDHCGEVLWRKLGRAGAFKIIRDAYTREWRAFEPWNPDDAWREREAKPAPPLIPPRMVRSIAWENKAKSIPKKVVLVNGWELNFYSSEGKPPQGSDIDGFWFDEEIIDPEWYPEMSARVVDRHGGGIWSATPQAGTDRLYELHETAEEERGRPDPSVEEFVLLLADNPHMSERDKRAFAISLSEEDRRVRIGGEFALTSFKVYPEFSMLIHGAAADMEIPPEWSRVVVIDPGHQVCAALFAAVPPDNDAVVLYDELYLRDCDAVKFADGLAGKQMGQTFEAFLIDPHMSIHTELGSGKTVGQQYTDALKAKRVGCVRTGSGFQMACDDVEAGILAVHGWLRVSQSGKPRLRVLSGRCPNFEFEIKRYHKRRVAGQVIDKPDQRKHNHLMDCLRYLALYNPRWVKPAKVKTPVGAAVAAWRAKRQRMQKRDGDGPVHLGPGKGGNGWQT